MGQSSSMWCRRRCCVQSTLARPGVSTAPRLHSQSFHLTEPRVWRGSVQGVQLASVPRGPACVLVIATPAPGRPSLRTRSKLVIEPEAPVFRVEENRVPTRRTGFQNKDSSSGPFPSQSFAPRSLRPDCLPPCLRTRPTSHRLSSAQPPSRHGRLQTGRYRRCFRLAAFRRPSLPH